MSMANNYMDYGIMGTGIISPVLATTNKQSLVFQATHKLDGTELPYRNRSFISFSFGGRDIEEFDLIAICDGDRMTRNLSAEFEDLTSSTDVVEGQYYHGTHYKTNSLSLTLSTDAMDLRTLEDFRNWFRGGTARPLILAEHPNREIIARVANPPELNMLPFEKLVTLNIGGAEYTTSVTEYRGDITLDFVMDEPFWYSRVNIFGSMTNSDTYIDSWEGVSIFEGTAGVQDALKDVLKMIYEDGIPISSMIAEPMILGGDIYASEGNLVTSSICLPLDEDSGIAQHGTPIYDESTDPPTLLDVVDLEMGYHNDGADPVLPAAEYFENYEEWEASTVYTLGYSVKRTNGSTVIGYTCKQAHTSGSTFDSSKWEEITIPVKFPAEYDPDNPPEEGEVLANKYYVGAVIEDPLVDPLGTKGTIFGPFIKSMKNLNGLAFPAASDSYSNRKNAFNLYYAGTAPAALLIKFTLPIKINASGYITTIGSKRLHEESGGALYHTMVLEGKEKQEMRFTAPNFLSSYNNVIYLFTNVSNTYDWEKLLGEIRDKIRHPEIRKIAAAIVNHRRTGNTVSGHKSELVEDMKNVFSNNYSKIEVSIDSKTGSALGKITYGGDITWRTVTDENENTTELAVVTETTSDEENIGDMISSNHLMLTERNYFNSASFTITGWEEGTSNAYRLYHTFPETLLNFSVSYKYMYY